MGCFLNQDFLQRKNMGKMMKNDEKCMNLEDHGRFNDCFQLSTG